MNQKTLSVLFCALLASTFVHELRAKGVHKPVSSSSNRHLDVLGRSSSSSNQVCTLQCTGGISWYFGLTVQVVENIIIIANSSSNSALLIEASSSIVVLLNGQSGAGVAINLSTQVGVYVSGNLWVQVNTELSAWVAALNGGLQAVINISGAVQFSVSSASSAILSVVNSIAVNLVLHLSSQISGNATVGLSTIISISAQIVVLVNGQLSGILTLFGSVSLKFNGDIQAFLNVFLGIAIVVVKQFGSLSAAIALGFALDLAFIFAAESGLLVLGSLLLAIYAVAEINATLLADEVIFFQIVSLLGGGVLYGISGVLSVIYYIVAFGKAQVSLEAVITVIIQYFVYSSLHVTADLSADFNASLNALISVTNSINATSSLSAVISIITQLQSGAYVVAGIAISSIINVLLAGVLLKAALIVQIIKVILLLKVAVELAIATLVLILIIKLNSAIGIFELGILGISVGISAAVIASGAILKTALAGFTALLQALRFASGLAFFAALVLIPLFSAITTVVAAAAVAAGVSLSLTVIFGSAGAVAALIIAYLEWITGVSIGASTTALANVKSIVSVTSGFGVSIGFNASVSASGSASGSSNSSVSGGGSSSGGITIGGISIG